MARQKRSEQKEETRQRLLDAAREVFEAEGFEGASLRQIAARAGIAAGTIFVHFRDKRDLLHAALFEDLAATLEAALAEDDADSLEAWLARLTDRMLGYYEARPLLSRVLLQQSLLAEPPWAERFAGQIAQVHAEVVRRAEVARAQGELAPDANLPLFAVAFVSFYMFGLIAWAQRSHPAPRELVRRLTAQHLDALRPGPNPTAADPGDHGP